MQTHSLRRHGRLRRGTILAALVAAAVTPIVAVETHYWIQDDLSDFEKGNLNRLSVRSDGRLFLAPVVTELLDTSTPYLWTVARDSKGNLYAGGGGPTGSTTKLLEIDASGKSKVLAEIEGMEIHAIAVDARDRVYAATAPDGKVYRMVNGKPEVFFDPKAKYIWAMAFSKAGDLYVATGDRGEIYKVTPDGHGSVFFQTEETHARSLAIDNAGNLIIGTEPGGEVVRITPTGAGFVLYQTPKREITAVAVGGDGSVYAAGVGTRSSAAPTLTPPPAPAPVPMPTPSPGPGAAALTAQPRPAATRPLTLALASSIAGGSEVYRIGPDGAPRRIWSHPQDIAYAMVIDSQGRPVVGTGNRGNIYRIDSDLLYTLVANLAPTQVTGFTLGSRGQIFAVTGNIGKVYRIGPEMEKSGTYESEPFDADAFTYWGRLTFEGPMNGGRVTVEARSGNVNHPQKNWTPWSSVPIQGDGGRVAAPPSRFLQYRATLAAAPDGKSPEVVGFDVAYMAKNVAPELTQVDITPANYKFSGTPALLAPSGNPQSITLPPLGPRKHTTTPSLEISSGQSMQYAKGFIGVRWAASDENGDPLSYRVEIRGEKETQWKLLKDKVHEKYFSWDSTAFPDGRYLVRITATDAPGNPPANALTADIVSDPFMIDNTPPQITGLTATPAANGKLEVRWSAKDALSVIDQAEYSVNGGEWALVEPVGRLSDSKELEYRLLIDHPQAGEYTIAVRVSDDYENESVAKTVIH